VLLIVSALAAAAIARNLDAEAALESAARDLPTS
jgi:hypothetical protein